MIKRGSIGAEQNVINHTPLWTGYIRALLSQSRPRNGRSLSERRFDKSFEIISLFQRSINRYGNVDLNFPPPFSIIIRRDRRFEKIIDLEKYLKKKNNQSYLSEQFKKFSTQKLSIDRIY